MPHSAGGQLGPNLFAQDRALNRGWSREGRAYRALEQRAISQSGVLLFVHATYVDPTDIPAYLTVGLLSDKDLVVRRFRNRFDVDLPKEPPLDTVLLGATDAEVGSLGEETAVVLLEDLGATIVSIGDDGHSRDEGRLIVVLDGALTAVEVKSRYNSAHAGRLTRAGNLARPRMRRAPNGWSHRQASQSYLAQRLTDYVDVNTPDYQGVDALVVAVDFECMLAQLFDVNDGGTRLMPRSAPISCAQAASVALSRIVSHKGHL